MTNKLYFRDDGLYIYSSADGQLDIIADTTAKVTAPTCELEGAVTLDGTTTIDSGHYMVFGSNDGSVASGNDGGTCKWLDLGSGNTVGWIRLDIDVFKGYIPVYSSNALVA
jgi:hypothetical protein